MHENKTFLCSHCDFKIEFPNHDEAQRKVAWERANLHEQACEGNPLVRRIKELESHVQAQPVGDPQTRETLEAIRLECRKRSALVKDQVRGIGFTNILRLVDQILG